jgi:hypothetical protein
MYSLNLWDVSHQVHEERLLEAQHKRLIHQLMPSVSAWRGARQALSRILHYLL